MKPSRRNRSILALNGVRQCAGRRAIVRGITQEKRRLQNDEAAKEGSQQPKPGHGDVTGEEKRCSDKGLKDFIGDVSIVAASLIQRDESLLAACVRYTQCQIFLSEVHCFICQQKLTSKKKDASASRLPAKVYVHPYSLVLCIALFQLLVS